MTVGDALERRCGRRDPLVVGWEPGNFRSRPGCGSREPAGAAVSSTSPCVISRDNTRYSDPISGRMRPPDFSSTAFMIAYHTSAPRPRTSSTWNSVALGASTPVRIQPSVA